MGWPMEITKKANKLIIDIGALEAFDIKNVLMPVAVVAVSIWLFNRVSSNQLTIFVGMSFWFVSLLIIWILSFVLGEQIIRYELDPTSNCSNRPIRF
jgi:hypothetical protein